MRRHAWQFATLVVILFVLAVVEDQCAARVEGGDVKVRIGPAKDGGCL